MREKLLDEHQKALNFVKEKGYDVLLSGYVGSQHLHLNDENSDYDFVVYVMPTKKELYLGRQNNQEYEVHANNHVSVLSWLELGTQMYKATYNLMEVLSDALFVDERVRQAVSTMTNMFTSDEVTKAKLAKNFYFTGFSYLEKSKRKPEEGSRVQFYHDGVDYKSLSRAWLFYHLLLDGKGTLYFAFMMNDLSDSARDFFFEVRQDRRNDFMEELETFYSKENRTTYLQVPKHSSDHYDELYSVLAEPLKYVF